MFRLFFSACLAASAVFVSADSITEKLPADAKKTVFHGFDHYTFQFDGVKAFLITPKEPASGNPWIWRARFFGHQPQTDIALLNNGFYLAYIEVGGLFGAPTAVERWNKYYDFLTGKLNLSKKPVLEGMSRGGLIIFNWAKKNPEKVAAIYADAPVCDFKSWPGGKGKGSGSPRDYQQCLKAYNLTDEQTMHYKDQPINKLDDLAKAGVPVLAVCGATDKVVPMDENINIFAANYRKLGGKIRVISKPGNGHHPHSLKDPAPIVNFLMENAVGKNEYIIPRTGIQNALSTFLNTKKGTVAFIGGSITEMNGYTKRTEENLKKLFPSCKFTFVNAGISSTCSDTGAFRLERDVLSKGKIDLLFVEFAVNDNQDGHLAPARSIRAMEGIVRQLRKKNPAADVVFLYTANESHLKNYAKNANEIAPEMVAQGNKTFDNSRKPGVIPQEIAAHEKVAEHYGISSVNFAADVQERMRHGEFDWRTFGGVHPASFGAEIYADDILALLRGEKEKCAKNTQAVPHRDVPKLDADCFENARLIPPSSAVVRSGWRIGVPDWKNIPGSKRDRFLSAQSIFAERPGSEFTLDFNGPLIGLYLTAGPDAGTVEYKIDDGSWKTRDLFHGYSKSLHYPYTAILEDSLKPGPHTLTLKISDKKNQSSTGTAVRIMNFTAN